MSWQRGKLEIDIDRERERRGKMQLYGKLMLRVKEEEVRAKRIKKM